MPFKNKICAQIIGTRKTTYLSRSATIKYISMSRGFFSSLLALYLICPVLSSCNDPGHSDTSATPSNREQSSLAAMTPEEKARKEKGKKEDAAFLEERRIEALGLRWTYDRYPDKMGRGMIITATVRSLNEIQFGPPYGGSQRGTLTLRVHPKYGRDVMLSIERGQFLCRVETCDLSVRFDEGKAQTYRAGEPADYSSDTLFLHGYDRFVEGLRKSKKMFIEAQFYQEATRVFEFDTTGLRW